ncbi:Uncharacterized isochorismatase family protein YrdC [Hyella patelloides LEGE 07179]|uniref:Uncharacterized isochorismatase family protein YrdC n=1 Tax=Hyella patelloides LEGE 07179 TaxID=945734 RepID=A0A563VJ34_9CYAN|nr:cysteine hydrolase family protein [Hyella patelloides]VEP11355.1 Uncharacterized isochorismatase family protein YrdC [Hyella patelloides LEGE 07179]
MEKLPDNTALLIVDVQVGFDDPKWGQRNNPHAEENIYKILQHWRHLNNPIIHIQHLSIKSDSPLRPNQPGCEFKEIICPQQDEIIIQKNVNSAFIGTQLEKHLQEQAIDSLVIVGLTTNHCISTTARMAGNLGFQTFVVSDATATFNRKGADGKLYSAEEIHDVSLANLHQEFATVITTGELLK